MERYCTQTIKVPFNSKVFYNTEIFVSLPKSGDAISKIRLVLESQNTLGEEIINETELITNGVSIEKLYGEFIKIENQFVTSLEMTDELNNLLYGQTSYIDIPFWTVKNKLFDFETLRILFSDSNSNQELNGYLLIDYVVFYNATRDSSYFQNFRNVSRLNIPFIDSVKQLTVDVYIPGSVYELWFTIKDSSTGIYVEDEVINNIRLSIGNEERFSISGKQARYIEPLKVYKSHAQDFPVYMYSFRLNDTPNIPSGQTNLTNSQRIIFDFIDNNSSYNLTIWGHNHDFYYKNEEKGIKKMFNSNELVLSVSKTLCTTFDNIPNLKTSYTFYVTSAAIQYSSNVEIQSITVTDTSCPSYNITQNEIIFGNLDSLNSTYYANVVFHSSGFKDVTCLFNFKSPKSIFLMFNGQSIGFYDTFYSGSPTFFIDGNQRLNAFYGTYLNGINYSKTITNVIADQYRNYLITFSDQSFSKSGINGLVTGIPSTYFDNYAVPCSNLFYTNSTSHNVSNCICNGSFCTSDGEFYISGTTLNSTPIVFDNTSVFSSGSGTKCILVKYSTPSNLSYCIIADNNSGPGLVSYTKNGPVFAFPVTSTTNLFCTGSTLTYNTQGISVAQLTKSGNFSWRYTINGSGLTLLKCVSTYFDNILFSYKSISAFYVTKLATNGSLKWSRSFTLLNKIDFSTVQDCMFVSYTAGTSNVVFANDFRSINVPANLTGVDVFDSNGGLINFYGVPTSNVSDFTTKTKDTYYTPLFDSSYFSNVYDYNYTKTYVNYWGVFVDGVPSTSVSVSDTNSTHITMTGQYGPYSSLGLPVVNKSAIFIGKINSTTGSPTWVSYIDNIVNTYCEYSSKLSINDVIVSGTYGTYESNIYNSDGSKFEGKLPSLSSDGLYIVKYNHVGFADWQTYLSSGYGTNNYTLNCDISNKNTSNIYVLGCTRQKSDIIPADTITLYNAKLTGDRVPTSSGLTFLSNVYNGLKSFIVNYNLNGQAQWYSYLDLSSYNLNNTVIIPPNPKMVTDSAGNLIMAFTRVDTNSDQPSSLKFINSDGTSYIMSSLTQYKGGFFLKISPSGFGVAFGFFRNSGVVPYGSNGLHYIRSIGTSSYDNGIFMSGDLYNYSTIQFFNGTSFSGSILNNSVTAGGNPDCFIAKYNSSGVYQWSNYIIHVGTDNGTIKTQSMTGDSVGNLYICGSYKNTSNVGTIYNPNGTPFTNAYLTGINYTGGFLIKYNSVGYCQWLVKIDSSNTEFIGSVTTTPDDKIVLYGKSYGNNVKFYESNGCEHNSYQPSSNSKTFSYCVKYDTNGFLIQI